MRKACLGQEGLDARQRPGLSGRELKGSQASHAAQMLLQQLGVAMAQLHSRAMHKRSIFGIKGVNRFSLDSKDCSKSCFPNRNSE